MEVILASNSPRRRELLKKICDFKVITSCVDETCNESNPQEFCKALALKKAQSVAKERYNSLVIGADTIVVANGKIIGKPISKEDNFRILKSLSGTCHYVLTGYALLYKDKQILGVEQTKVIFNTLTDSQILQYANSGEGLDKAGGYGIQDNDLFVKEIVGSYDNVVGFPTEKIEMLIKKIEEEV